MKYATREKTLSHRHQPEPLVEQDENCGNQYDDPAVKPGFTLSFEFVTPLIAKAWLERNHVNRSVTRHNVDKFNKALKAKRFGTTHHGVAFNRSGFLIDGQHRLMAIVETGIGVWLVVARGMDVERAIDLQVDGGARRSNACMLEKPRQTVEIASAMVKLMVGSIGDVYEVSAMHDVIEPHALRLLDACNTQKATRSAANSRAPIVIQMIRYPEAAEELCQQYRRYVLLEELGSVWPSVMSLIRQVDSRSITSTRQNELFVKTFLAFDPLKKSLTKIYVKDEIAAVGMIREHIRALVSK